MLETKLEKTWMSGMFWVVFLTAYLAQQSVSAPPCNSPTVWHTDGTDSRCCRAFDCAPGSQPNICITEFTVATCAPCPDERFNDIILSSAPPTGKMESCKVFTRCDPKYQKVVSDGNATHDRICECLDGDLLGADAKCYSPCPPGEFWVKDESTCNSCPEGTFKDAPGGQMCSRCTVCNATETACSPTGDAVCVREKKTESVADPGGGFPGWAVALIVFLLLLFVVVLVLCIGRKKYGKWFWCRKCSPSSYNPRSSSGPAPSSGTNGTTPSTEETVALSVSGSTNADNNDISPSSRQSQSTHGFSRRLAKYCCCKQSSHSSANVEQPESNGPDATTPLNRSSSEQTDDEIQQSDSPSGGNNGRLDHNQLEGGGTTETHTITIPLTTPITQSDNCNGHPPTDVPPTVGSGVQSSGDGSSPDGPPPGGSGGQPASIIDQPNANEGQPSGATARSDPANSGDRGSGEDQGPRSVNADASLCAYDQSKADRSTSKDSFQSFAPQTGLRLNSGPNTLPEAPNYDLKSDDESIITKYISRMQRHYNDILKTLYIGVFFIGHLYQEKVLTRDQQDDIMILKDQVSGKAKILCIIQDALLRSGDKAAEPFLNALVDPDSRQDAVAMLIDPERATELIRIRDGGEIANDAEDSGQRVESIRDDVDYAAVVLGSNAPNPNETPVKVPASGVHDPNETPVKDILEIPQIDLTQKTGDDEDQWNDPCVSVTKCDHRDIR